ncbi:MAG: cysteine dioxygenase family protein [Acidobacteriota bacterium]
MEALEFSGRAELLKRLDAAVALDEVGRKTRAVQTTLCDLIRAERLALPTAACRPAPDGYARRLVHHSEPLGYSVVLMVWGPGQGTQLHDHDGSWCVEGVIAGEIEVVQYEAVEQRDDRWHFRPEPAIRAGEGTSGSLIPPFEYHTIANPHDDRVAMTLHVYSRELRQAHVFEPLGNGWYRRRVRQLGYVH